MRRPLVLLTIPIALALVPSAAAQESVPRMLQAGGARVELENGRGFAFFRSREGVILGSIKRGRVVVTDLRRDSEVSVSGCETTKRIKRTIVCIGRDLSFSVEKGAWNALLRGVGINASAVLRGTLTLQGRAGTLQINDRPERAWPKAVRTFRLR
jgi:hypothetical protein